MNTNFEKEVFGGQQYAHIALEVIGYDTIQTLKNFGGASEAKEMMPWCAEIVGFSKDDTLRVKFLKGIIRFDGANSKWSRGVMLHFYPEITKHYVAYEHTSWKNSQQFYFRVNSRGEIIRKSEEEVLEWARKLVWE